MFMRSVKSRTFFEQMKGRGVRVIDPNDLQPVTRDARAKTHFVIVDCVGVTEQELLDTRPLDKQPRVPLEKLLQHVGIGGTSPDVIATLASRLARLDKQLDDTKRASQQATAKGISLREIVSGLIEAPDPDRHIDAARKAAGLGDDVEPTSQQLAAAAKALFKQAAAPLASNPDLRKELVLAKQQLEQTIDNVSQDELLAAGHSAEARERAKSITASWEQYIAENKDELTALQVLYSQLYGCRPNSARSKRWLEQSSYRRARGLRSCSGAHTKHWISRRSAAPVSVFLRMSSHWSASLSIRRTS
jgi:type I restriction enzyme R subunit